MSVARSGVLLVVDVVLGRRRMQPIPQITRDVLGLADAAVGIATLCAIGLEPASLLTTSALSLRSSASCTCSWFVHEHECQVDAG